MPSVMMNLHPAILVATLVGLGLAVLPQRLAPLVLLFIAGALFWKPELLQQPQVPLEMAEPSRKVVGNSKRSDLKLKADANGHFYVSPLINGIPIKTMIDTGATEVSLSYEDAERLKLNPGKLKFDVRTTTANGETVAARVKLNQVRVGAIDVRDVSALVGRRGAIDTSLLGMSFLKNVRLRMEGGELALYK